MQVIRKSAGDTIVEVMISLTILSLALGISYATANRSLRNLRQAQENARVTSLVQAQAEGLRALSENGKKADAAHNIFVAGKTPFCVNTTSNTVTTNVSSTSPCYDKGIQAAVQVVYSDTTTDTFTITGTWDDISGDGSKDSVRLYYRVHEWKN